MFSVNDTSVWSVEILYFSPERRILNRLILQAPLQLPKSQCDELFLVPCPYRLTWAAQPGSPVTVESRLDQEHVAEPNFDEPKRQALFTVICHLDLI